MTPLIACVCGAMTMEVLTRRQGDAIVSCWASIDEAGFAQPGCLPDERTYQLMGRRNPAIRGDWPKPRATYNGGTIIRCACGRDTRVVTSNLTFLDDPPAVENPPDASIPVGSTSCWLSVGDDDGPDVGCAPDWRTWDILERRRRNFAPYRTTVELAPVPSVIIPESERAAFAALQFEAATGRMSTRAPKTRRQLAADLQPPAANVRLPTAAPTPAAIEPELSLFG